MTVRWLSCRGVGWSCGCGGGGGSGGGITGSVISISRGVLHRFGVLVSFVSGCTGLALVLVVFGETVVKPKLAGRSSAVALVLAFCPFPSCLLDSLLLAFLLAFGETVVRLVLEEFTRITLVSRLAVSSPWRRYQVARLNP